MEAEGHGLKAVNPGAKADTDNLQGLCNRARLNVKRSVYLHDACYPATQRPYTTLQAGLLIKLKMRHMSIQRRQRQASLLRLPFQGSNQPSGPLLELATRDRQSVLKGMHNRHASYKLKRQMACSADSNAAAQEPGHQIRPGKAALQPSGLDRSTSS